MRNWRHLLGTSPVRVEPQAVMLKYFAVSADSAPLGEQSLDRTAFLAASIEGLGRNFAPYPLLTYDIAVLSRPLRPAAFHATPYSQGFASVGCCNGCLDIAEPSACGKIFSRLRGANSVNG